MWDSEVNDFVKVWPRQICLISELCKELSCLSREDLARVIVILPTRRLATYVTARLCQLNKAIYLPHYFTLDQFVDYLQPSTHKEISDHTFELILSAIIREHSYKHIALGNEHELMQFFRDIHEFKMDENIYKRIHQIFSELNYAGELSGQLTLDRFKEIEDIFIKVSQVFNDHNLKTESQLKSHQAENLLSKIEELLKNDCEHLKKTKLSRLLRSKLYFVGFTTVKEYYKPLLKSFETFFEAKFWFSDPPDLHHNLNPLQDLITSLSDSKEVSDIKQQNLQNTAALNVHSCHNIFTESIEALGVAKKYIASGYSPSKIAILLPDESRYGPIIQDLFLHTECKNYFSEKNLSVSKPLQTSPIGIWFYSLTTILCKQNDQNRQWNIFIKHPITLRLLTEQIQLFSDKSVMDIKTMLWEQVNLLLEEIPPYKYHLSEFIKYCRNLELIKALKKIEMIFAEFWTLFERKIINGSQVNFLSTWLEGIVKVIDRLNVFSCEVILEKGEDQSAKNTVKMVLDDLKQAAQLKDFTLNLEEFAKIFNEKVFSGDIRSIGYPFNGVQIISLVEARNVPFEVVIILGCMEGVFPKPVPKDYLIDDWLKVKMGLFGWDYIESLEEVTYQLIKDRVQHLHLFYSNQDFEDRFLKSRFIEGLSHIQNVTYYDHTDYSIDRFFKEYKSYRVVKTHSENTSIKVPPEVAAGLIRKQSAYTLKQLMQCPIKFLLQKLELKAVELEPPEEHLQEGRYLHQIFNAFYTGKHKQEEIEYEVNANAEDRFLQTINKIIPHMERFAPLKFHLEQFAAPAFLQQIYNQASHEKNEVITEWRIGQGQGISFKMNKVLFVIEGSIDRVEKIDDRYLIIDYKRKNIPTRPSIVEGEEIQLILYALALNHDELFDQKVELDQIILGYWSILDGKWLPCYDGLIDFKKSVYYEAKGKEQQWDMNKQVLRLQEKWWEFYERFVLKEETWDLRIGDHCRQCSFAGVCRRSDGE